MTLSASTVKSVRALQMDEVTIRKHVSWEGKKYQDFVDPGTGAEPDDSAPFIKEALVLIVMSVNSTCEGHVEHFFLSMD